MENSNLHKITNLEYLVGLSRGDNKFVNKMLNVFLEETPAEVDNLEQSIQQKNFEAIKAVAHKLKSTIPFVGLDSVIGKEIDQIESLAAKGKDYEIIQKDFVKVKESFNSAFSELTQYLGK